MSNPYIKLTHNFETIIDFIRFGFSEANKGKLFFGHGTDNAWDDIVWLVCGSLHLPFEIEPHLLSAKLTAVEKTFLCEQLASRIIARIPTAYLLKEAHFCGLEFYVDERVLIPRSPIAQLIEKQFTPWVNPDNVHNILDLCTGSACIAVACAYAFPEAHIDAIDISEDALEVAEINRNRHGLPEQLSLYKSDCWTHVPAIKYDIIVSNPPYVGAKEMATLPAEYNHEPEIALQTEKNGLAIVEKILQNANSYLKEDGILVVEVGNSEEELINAYPELDFYWLEFERGGQGVFLLTQKQLKTYFG